jgi:hypothetical protein
VKPAGAEKISRETQERACPDRWIRGSRQLAKHLDGRGLVPLPKLQLVTSRERRIGSLPKGLHDREVGNALFWGGLDEAAAKRDYDRSLGPLVAAGCQALLTGREHTLKRRNDEIRGELDPLASLLVFQDTILFEQTPPEPQERGEWNDRDPDD